jgi:hypothetical protein
VVTLLAVCGMTHRESYRAPARGGAAENKGRCHRLSLCACHA